MNKLDRLLELKRLVPYWQVVAAFLAIGSAHYVGYLKVAPDALTDLASGRLLSNISADFFWSVTLAVIFGRIASYIVLFSLFELSRLRFWKKITILRKVAIWGRRKTPTTFNQISYFVGLYIFLNSYFNSIIYFIESSAFFVVLVLVIALQAHQTIPMLRGQTEGNEVLKRLSWELLALQKAAGGMISNIPFGLIALALLFMSYHLGTAKFLSDMRSVNIVAHTNESDTNLYVFTLTENAVVAFKVGDKSNCSSEVAWQYIPNHSFEKLLVQDTPAPLISCR